MFESRGTRLVRESVGNKSAKLYRPCLKLTSIQSVVPNKGYTSQKITNRWLAELNKGSLNYSEKNKLGEDSYGNVYHGDYEGMFVFVKQFKRNNLHKLFVEANVLRDLQTIRHNEHFPYFFEVSRCTNTTAILPNCRKKLRDH